MRAILILGFLLLFPVRRRARRPDIEIRTEEGSRIYQMQVWRGKRPHPEAVREFRSAVERNCPELRNEKSSF